MRCVTSPTEDRARALRRLPRAHSLALRLRDLGATDELIAECLGIARRALRPFIEVAEAKLAAQVGDKPAIP